MRKFIIILIIFIISVVVILQFIRSPEPITPSRTSNLESNWKSERFNESSDSRRYGLGNQTYRVYDEKEEKPVAETEISVQKIRAYTNAFVEVQSYMDMAGSEASYKETKKIVKKYGLSEEDYTRISTLMNKNPTFRESVQKLINEVKDSIREQK